MFFRTGSNGQFVQFYDPELHTHIIGNFIPEEEVPLVVKISDTKLYWIITMDRIIICCDDNNILSINNQDISSISFSLIDNKEKGIKGMSIITIKLLDGTKTYLDTEPGYPLSGVLNLLQNPLW